MNRREFIQNALTAASAGILMDWSVWSGVYGPKAFAAEGTPLLAVSRDGAPEEMTRAAVAALGSMKAFVSPGETVVVKPNIGWDRTPELAANTNPEVVRAVVAMCMEAGAKSVKVIDRPCNDPRRCYKRSGIQDAVLSLGLDKVTVEHIDDRKFVDVPVKNPIGSMKTLSINRDFLEADKVINIPIAKHHNAARLTMGLKNAMGILGGNRGNIHHDLDRNIADINSVFKFHLTVLDGVRVLTANGPQGGRTKDVKELNTVVAGRDPVAVDSYGATLFGLTAADVPHIIHSAKLGLGVMDLSKVKVTNARPG